MVRTISYTLYAAAFLVSLLLFLSGIFVGNAINHSNLESLSSEVDDVSNRVASIQLLLLMEGNSSSFCPVYTEELQTLDAEVEQVGHKLSFLEEESNVYDVELKKEYFVLQAESYLLSKRVKEICGDRSVLLIHFYSNVDCPECKEQGAAILQARDDLVGEVNVKLYSFDGTLGSSVADAFVQQYGVRTYPSIVINGRTFEGYLDSEQLQQLIRENH